MHRCHKVDRQLSSLIAGLDKAVATVAGKIETTIWSLTERYVDPTEIDKVMAFFRAHWDPQHISATTANSHWQFSPERCAGLSGLAFRPATLWDGNKLVGFLGVIGCGFNGSGTVVHGAWLCDLTVVPQYRRLAVGRD